jgi:predicted metalloprotease with PDZ domain
MPGQARHDVKGWNMRFLPIAALLASAPAFAQTPTPAPVDYLIQLDDAAHHTARITVTWRDLPAAPLRFQMARSSPGRYAIHEFAKNVFSVSATDGAGKPIALQRTDPFGWTAPAHDGTVVVTYTLFGDRGDGTYDQIDASHAHLDMPATMMWATGQDARPVRVRFAGQDPTWKVATQLKLEADGSWSAPNLQYLMDSPTELSNHAVREWTLPGSTYRWRIALHHQGTDTEADDFAAKAKRIVAEQIKIFGEPAPYDYGTYTFLADYLPWVDGDGMEHRNSTVIIQPNPLGTPGANQIGTLSHEFFHSWNVERLRPAELEPFDFTRANPTRSLWFAEGFTNYYGPLAILRSGVGTFDDWLAGVSNNLSGVLTSPARNYGGPQEMSLRAPFVDAATSIDPRVPYIFLSYYSYGQAIATALDLTLRQKFPGVTLDDYMRYLWRTRGKPERPYTNDDLRLALGAVTKDQAFADAFFAETIAGSRLPDFVPLLAQAGLALRPANPGKGWIGGIGMAESDGGAVLAGYPAPGTPLYVAGIDKGDRLVAIDGAPVTSATDATTRLAALAPGASARLRFVQRGVERDGTLTAVADPSVVVMPVEKPTAAQRAFRRAWLGVR